MVIPTHFTIPVDPGYGFDYLSIFAVKTNKIGDEKSITNYKECLEHIALQIGYVFTNEILGSKEYENLYKANLKLFEMVDLVKEDPCKGKELDDQVYVRYLAKVALQNKFFPEKRIIEQKVGYVNSK
jgi:hypothetical protein